MTYLLVEGFHGAAVDFRTEPFTQPAHRRILVERRHGEAHAVLLGEYALPRRRDELDGGDLDREANVAV